MKRLLVISACVVWLAGCQWGGGKAQQTIDPPPEVTVVDEEATLSDKEQSKESEQTKEKTEKTVLRELYLLDEKGMLVPTVLKVPHTTSVAKQSVEYLVKNGPVTELLPEGFQAILPAGTEVLSVNLVGDTIVVDFSPEFKEYKAEEEERILQSITYTLTQFDQIQKVKLQINGHELKEMPVNHTPIDEGVSRLEGINFENESINDVTQTYPVIVYFLTKKENAQYFVPVTRRVQEQLDPIEATVQEVLKGPSVQSGLLTPLKEEVKLVEKPKYENGVVTLNFNDAILNNNKENKIADEIVQSLVLSLTEQEGIEKVAILVNGQTQVQQASGKLLTEPVARPKNVNIGTF
ncbi:GerMN domain-containing protein [Massilibacterium senegalense]|uniref:GerMN domain-containing protein n=1 Tax=Massilibacterium senegalense TaxID=1632858 RepID=UPI000780C682|nr:GerMN domain-containing protein [Massilibacterium senegalense]